jgi:hypothetical protein
MNNPPTLSGSPVDAARVALTEGMTLIDAPSVDDPAYLAFETAMTAQTGPLDDSGRYYTASTVDGVNILTSLIERSDGAVAAARQRLKTESFDGWITEVIAGGKIAFEGRSFVRGLVAAKFTVSGGVAATAP